MADKEYIVWRKEVWIQGVRVNAKSAKEAIVKVAEGEGSLVENTLDYDSTCEPSLWSAEVTPEHLKKI